MTIKFKTEVADITCTITRYVRYNTKTWRKVSEITDMVDMTYYNNVIDSISFFSRLGRTYTKKGYTKYGCIPTMTSSVSPDGKEKIVYTFKFN